MFVLCVRVCACACACVCVFVCVCVKENSDEVCYFCPTYVYMSLLCSNLQDLLRYTVLANAVTSGSM